MTKLRAILVLGAVFVCSLTTSARAQITCTYSQQKTSGIARGLMLEQGTVTCGSHTAGRVSHTAGVSILHVDMRTPGRRIETTSPPAKAPPDGNPHHFVGKVFELQLPTHYLKRRSWKKKPIIFPKFVAEAVVDGNLSTNCCVYIRAKARNKATWLRGLEIANGRINTPVKGNSDKPCETDSGKRFCFYFDASLLIDRAGRAKIQKIDKLLPPLERRDDIRTAVTGSHMLVEYGRVVMEACPATGCTSEFFGPNSRTAVGLIGDSTMLVVAVDSKHTGTGKGLQLDELATFLRDDLKADAAINLDGGGSTVMGVRRVIGGTIVNRPRDSEPHCDQPAPRGGCERYVGNALIIGTMVGRHVGPPKRGP